MHPTLKILATLVFFGTYLFGAYHYEVWLFETARWWWEELIRLRSTFSAVAAFWHFVWVAFTTFVVLPHFVWLPVWLLKEGFHLFRQYQFEQPYKARCA